MPAAPSQHLPEAAALPERIGTVRIAALIGQGSMGEVYRGEDEELGRAVAVKVLSEPTDLEALERFDREAQALARLSHPNVVGVFHKGIWRDRPYFIMELVEGPTVADILDGQGPFTVNEAVEIIRQAALGLEAAALAGVTHRDVKPANLLVARDGTVKVADFGVCKIADRSAGVTEQGTTLGTPFYMAPEQARGEAVDPRADQYSLGATFFHLVCGRPPYETTQTVAQLLAHQKEPVPDIHVVAPSVPVKLARVIRRMMAKSPAQRFDTYADMLDELDEAVSVSGPRFTIRSALLWSALGAAALLAVLPAVLGAADDDEVAVAAPVRVEKLRPPPDRRAVVPVTPEPSLTAVPPESLKQDEVETLLKRIATEKGKARASAMTSLARTKDERARPALEAILADNNDGDGPMAAVLLGELGDQQAAGALIVSLGSARRATVLAAVDALVRLRDVRAVEALKKLAETHSDATVRARAQRAGKLLFAVEGE